MAGFWTIFESETDEMRIIVPQPQAHITNDLKYTHNNGLTIKRLPVPGPKYTKNYKQMDQMKISLILQFFF